MEYQNISKRGGISTLEEIKRIKKKVMDCGQGFDQFGAAVIVGNAQLNQNVRVMRIQEDKKNQIVRGAYWWSLRKNLGWVV